MPADIISHEVVTATLDLYSEVRSGIIRLSGYLFTVSLRLLQIFKWSVSINWQEYSIFAVQILLDYCPTSLQLHCLPILVISTSIRNPGPFPVFSSYQLALKGDSSCGAGHCSLLRQRLACWTGLHINRLIITSGSNMKLCKALVCINCLLSEAYVKTVRKTMLLRFISPRKLVIIPALESQHKFWRVANFSSNMA